MTGLTQKGTRPSFKSSFIASANAAPRNVRFSSDSMKRIRTKPGKYS